jgi:hypothetical protein
MFALDFSRAVGGDLPCAHHEAHIMSFKVHVGPPQIAIHQGQTVLVTEPDGEITWPSEKGLYFLDTRIISKTRSGRRLISILDPAILTTMSCLCRARLHSAILLVTS